MKNRKWFTVIGVVALALSVIASVSAQDWPQWRGINRDGKVNHFMAPERWPPELSLQWRDSLGTGDATPIIMGDKLYVFARQADQEVLLCLDADRGEEQWRMEYTAPAVTGAGARHPGPRSTPVASENKMLALGVSGILSCVDMNTCELLWRKDPFPGVVPMFFTACPLRYTPIQPNRIPGFLHQISPVIQCSTPLLPILNQKLLTCQVHQDGIPSRHCR